MRAKPWNATETGFTLLEMLVVLVIMGLLAGLVATIAQPGDRARLRVEADRLARLLDLAATQARLTGRSVGWTADGSTYRFWQVTDDGLWLEIGGNDPLRARTLPSGMSITGFRVEAMRPPGAMRLIFEPDGIAPAFTVELSFGAAHFTIASSPVGEVQVVSREADHGAAAN